MAQGYGAAVDARDAPVAAHLVVCRTDPRARASVLPRRALDAAAARPQCDAAAILCELRTRRSPRRQAVPWSTGRRARCRGLVAQRAPDSSPRPRQECGRPCAWAATSLDPAGHRQQDHHRVARARRCLLWVDDLACVGAPGGPRHSRCCGGTASNARLLLLLPLAEPLARRRGPIARGRPCPCDGRRRVCRRRSLRTQAQ